MRLDTSALPRGRYIEVIVTRIGNVQQYMDGRVGCAIAGQTGETVVIGRGMYRRQACRANVFARQIAVKFRVFFPVL